MAGEREFLESLFGTRGEDERDLRRVGQVHALSRHKRMKSTVDGGTAMQRTDKDWVKKLLDRDFEGCGRPLKVRRCTTYSAVDTLGACADRRCLFRSCCAQIRVQQTIKSQESPIMAYRIATLIHFYKVTMERTVGEDTLMSGVLSEIKDHAYEAFFETLRAQGRSLLRFIQVRIPHGPRCIVATVFLLTPLLMFLRASCRDAQPPAAALSAPAQLRDVLSTLREILTVCATSLLEQEGLPQAPRTLDGEFREILDAALDPALEMCERMAEMRPAEWDRAVFRINCDEAVLAALEAFDFVHDRRDAVQGEEEKHVETVTAAHVSRVAHLARASFVMSATDPLRCIVRVPAPRKRSRAGG